MNDNNLKSIEILHKTDMNASIAGDYDTLLSLWTDDGVLLPPDDLPVRGKEALREMMNRQKKAGAAYTITEYKHHFEEVEIIGDWAFEWGTYTGTAEPLDGSGPIHESGKLMRILKRQNDGAWKVARAIYNTD